MPARARPRTGSSSTCGSRRSSTIISRPRGRPWGSTRTVRIRLPSCPGGCSACATRSGRGRATASGATPRPCAARSRLGTAAPSTRAGALPRDRRPAFPPVRGARRELMVNAIFADPAVCPAAPQRPVLRDRAASGGSRQDAVRGRAGTRVLAAPDRRVPLRRVPAAHEGPAARRLPDAYEGGLLPALRRRDGGDVADARHPVPRRGRLHERAEPARDVGRDGPRRPRVGRGLVRRSRLDPVRPHPGARNVRGPVFVRVELGRGRCGPAQRRPRARHDAVNPRAPDASDLPEGSAPGRGSRTPSLVGVGLVLLACWVLPSASERRCEGGGATSPAIPVGSRPRADGSSRASCAIRASRFLRAQRSSISSGRSVVSSASTGAPLPAPSPGRATGRRCRRTQRREGEDGAAGAHAQRATRPLAVGGLRGFASLRSVRGAAGA